MNYQDKALEMVEEAKKLDEKNPVILNSLGYQQKLHAKD